MSDNIERRDADSRIWVLGAPDPEMEMIERTLRECGETVVYAADARGERVTAGTAYRGESLVTDVGNHPCTSGVTDVYLVECELLTPDVRFEPGEDICHPELAGRTVRRIDHHRPGDPGYGRPPSEFLEASSIGQVIAELARLGRLPSPWQRGQLSAGTPGQWVLRGYRGMWTVAEAVEYPRHRRAVYVPIDIILAAAADHCLGAAYRGECPGVDPDALTAQQVALI